VRSAAVLVIVSILISPVVAHRQRRAQSVLIPNPWSDLPDVVGDRLSRLLMPQAFAVAVPRIGNAKDNMLRRIHYTVD